MNQINNDLNIKNIDLSKEFGKNIKQEKAKIEYKPDSIEISSIKQDKSNNGKFDISECAKNFIKGVLSPLTAVIEHPVMTIGMVAATAVACSLVPVLGPIMAVGFGALSVFQLGKSAFDVAVNIKNKEYDQAEKAFNGVGQGTVGVAMSVLGAKQSAKVAKEAKLMNELGVSSLNKAQKLQISKEVSKGTTLDALKEIKSLFTTRAGLKAVASQFKPSNISARAKDMFRFLFTKESKLKVEKQKMKFAETAEGKRRAAMTSEQIEAEVKSLYKEACDDCGIPEKLRPEIKVIKDNPKQGGGYNSSNHTITINENAYREGVFDLPDVIRHETTHANEAILRQRLSTQDKERVVVEYLSNRIQSGEKDNVITGGSFLGLSTPKPPKLNAQMKMDFSALAKDKLYKMVSYSDDELTAMVEPLVRGNKEFIQGYNNVDDAIAAMRDYAKGHNLRYKIAMQNSSGFNTSNIDVGLLKELTEEEKIAAIKSLRDGIDCIESNVAGQGIMGFGGVFNQYQFTPEEVLAQRNGNNFEIAKLESKLAKLRSQQNYDLSEEARLLDQIKKSKLTIEYKTKGQEMYRLYTESVNNPENTVLANQVKALKSELKVIQQQIMEIDGMQAKDILGTEIVVISNEYIPRQVYVHPETGTTIAMPINTTNASEIIADNFDNKE